jgi:hypothetical protein
VLAVDDDTPVLLNMAELMDDLNHDVAEAASAERALVDHSCYRVCRAAAE